MEAKTPREMMEELDSLSQALSGLSSAVREKVLSKEASAKSTSPVPSIATHRKLSPGEKQSHRVKVEARRQQEERTAHRIEELRSRSTASTAARLSGGRNSITASPTTKSRQELSQALDFDHEVPDRTMAKSERVDKEEVYSLPTAMKRNITSRRSKERHEILLSKQPSDLTAKISK